MLTEFFQKLAGTSRDAQLPELDARLATGALLVRVAKSDEHYAVEEIVEIDKILARRDNLNPVEAAKLRATCEKIEASGPKTREFTDLVQAAVNYEERRALCDALWAVGLADRKLKPEERALLDRVTQAFGVATDDLTNATAENTAPIDQKTETPS